jgi:hypothetical protein
MPQDATASGFSVFPAGYFQQERRRAAKSAYSVMRRGARFQITVPVWE